LKKTIVTYIIILILLAVLPINGTNSMLNNNYLLNIRWDYLAHALVYIPLVPLILFSSENEHNNGSVTKNRIMVYTLSLLFAFVLEGVQFFLSYRAFNINDMVANGIGVSLGLLIFMGLPLKKLFLNQTADHK